METTKNKEELVTELKKIIEVINELIKSGIEFFVDAKNDIWSFLESMIEKIFAFFESIFSKKEIIDLLNFNEQDLFV